MKLLNECLEPEGVDENRYEDCKHYSDCLETAAIVCWKSFSCKDCGDYKKSKIKYAYLTHYDKSDPPSASPRSLSKKEMEHLKEKMKELGIKSFNHMNVVT